MSKLLERLRDAKRSGVYRVTRRDALDDAVRGSRIDVAEIDLAGGDALEALARGLSFPAWFGNNWDALEDCLGDLSWRSGEAHVLVLRNAAALARDDFGVLLDVLRVSAEYWLERGKPFFAVLLDPQAQFGLPALHREPAS
jgi:hypothetical protein